MQLDTHMTSTLRTEFINQHIRLNVTDLMEYMDISSYNDEWRNSIVDAIKIRHPVLLEFENTNKTAREALALAKAFKDLAVFEMIKDFYLPNSTVDVEVFYDSLVDDKEEHLDYFYAVTPEFAKDLMAAGEVIYATADLEIWCSQTSVYDSVTFNKIFNQSFVLGIPATEDKQLDLFTDNEYLDLTTEIQTIPFVPVTPVRNEAIPFVPFPIQTRM